MVPLNQAVSVKHTTVLSRGGYCAKSVLRVKLERVEVRRGKWWLALLTPC